MGKAEGPKIGLASGVFRGDPTELSVESVPKMSSLADMADAAPNVAVPEDVQGWLDEVLEDGESVAACLLADILPDGKFGESWAFLTDRRLFVLSPNGAPGRAALSFQVPFEEIESGDVREFVGACALFVTSGGKAHEVARFSLSSRHEATNLCHALTQIVEAREAGQPLRDVALTAPRQVAHRCSKCGRALRRAGEICPHCIDTRQVVVRLLSFLYPYRWQAVLGFTLTFVMTGIGLAPPYLQKVLLDDVILKDNLGLLKVVVLLLIGVYVGRAVLSTFRSYVMQWLGNRVLLDLRVRLFGHLQMLPLSYYNQRQTGRIMSRVTGDLSRLQFFIAEGFQEILINLATVVLIAVIMALMDPTLFLLALAPVPIIVGSTVVFGRAVHRLYHRIYRRMASVSAILTDTIPGIRVVKSFAQEKRESKRFSNTSADLFDQQLRATRLSSGFFPFLGLLTAMGSILIVSVGGYMTLTGDVSPGVLVAFMGYMWRFYMPVQSIGRINHRLQSCLTSAERVFEILDSDVEPIERTDGLVLKPLQGEVTFENVQFGYEPGKYALKDVSFTVQPGEMIGLVGPSGAGKSTLVHLIARFYDVDEGRILIDGHNVQDLDLLSFRQQIGVVLQDPYLFHGSVWSNIAYAKPEAEADEVIAAARAANAHDFIVNLPDGYDTVIGERGQTLSGGERQRISIARAVLRNPRILILDEATASVDAETELLIQTALERLVENRTTFAIAHRLSTLRKANRLMVLERGELVEAGTHEELIESGGLYSRLVEIQSRLSKIKAW